MKFVMICCVLLLSISCSKQDWYYPLLRPYVYVSGFLEFIGLPLLPLFTEDPENDYYLMFDNAPGDRYVDGVLEPKRPDYKESIRTYYGVDTNKNGIRDEVEIWINSNVYSAVGRKFYREFYLYLVPLVRKYSASKTLPTKDDVAFDRYDKMFNCLRAIDTYSRDPKSDFFISVIFNSEARSRAYARFWNFHMYGLVTNRIKSNDTCQGLGTEYEEAMKWNEENAKILWSVLEKRENGKWKWCVTLSGMMKRGDPLYRCEGDKR